jgi:citrate lyase subunit beta / citryl-CoA lyase
VTWMPPGPALLFCPADRPERYDKAAATADMVILDLEDGVSAHDRPAARAALMSSALDPRRTIVRLNPVGTADHQSDLEALSKTSYEIVMLSKTESDDHVRTLRPRRVIALCETPIGVLASPHIAAADNAVALMWGAEDLIAALGGRSSRHADTSYRDVARVARAQVLLAAGAHGRAAIDAVHLDIADLEGLRSEAEDGAASSFSATACIHPTQVAVVQHAYQPTDDETAWARTVVQMAETARGVFTYEGRMIDAPLLHQAERILARTRQPQSPD